MCLKWLPRGLPRPWRAFKQPDGGEGTSWAPGASALALASVFAGFNGVQCRLLGNLTSDCPLDSKKSRFFRRPPRPDDACRRLKNPGENHAGLHTSCSCTGKQISRATNKGTYHIRLPIQKEADSRC